MIYNLWKNFFEHCDAPRPWGLYFQDSASPQMEALVELHDNIMFYLVIILFAVGWILTSIVVKFIYSKSGISNKYVSHGTLVELIWTITPGLILIFIAFTSFKLLYLMDEVSDINMTLYIEGFCLSIAQRCSETKWNGLKSDMLNKIKDTYIKLYIRRKKVTLISYPAQKIRMIPNTNWPVLCNTANCYDLIYHKTLWTKPLVFLLSNINHKKSFHTKVKASARIGPHNKDVISVIIGSLLGDSYANARSIEGTRIRYKQSIIHKDYFFWLYEFFYSRGYCTNLEPRKYTSRIKKHNVTTEYYGYEFNTFTFRSFNWIHKMFYKKGKKVINLKLKPYLTPLALAIWIMDDGCWTKAGVRIAANSFTKQEVKLLVTWLKDLFDIDCTLQKLTWADQHSIYIKAKSVLKLRKLVLPHMHKSMYYKLGLTDVMR